MGTVVVAVGMMSATVPGMRAQALGTFQWQLQPYCNVVTLSVHLDAGVYALNGYDDQCGGPAPGSVVGTAFLSPDGTIGLGLSGATAPGAAPVMLYARLSPATVSGTWHDSAGNSGAFVFTQGAATGVAPRPVPPNGIRPASVTAQQIAPGAVGTAHIALGSITAAQIAPGAVGATQISAGSITAAQIALGSLTGAHMAAGSITGAQIAASSIGAAHLVPGTVQVPIIGTCPVGQYLRGVTSAGAVICEPFFVPTLSTTIGDPARLVGYDPSIAIGADGLPVISHRDGVAGALRVTKCGNASCTTGNVSTIVDDQVNLVGVFTSVAIGADGRPVISHHDITAGTLRVTKCGNAACTTGNVSTTVDDPANNVGGYSSIRVGPDGLPVISHWDSTAGALRVTKCGNASCSAGNESTTVDDTGSDVGAYSSIAIGADGLPVISYYEDTVDALRVTKCGNPACTAGNVSTTVDDPANGVGGYTSIAIGADGLPVISHGDFTAGALRVTKCGNPACTAGSVSTTVDDPDHSVGRFSSIAIGADGWPVISHYDLTAGALRVTKCGNAACTVGNVSTTVDDPVNDVGRSTSIAIGADGLPVISHFDATAYGLRVTKCATQTCR
jgi:hypothetical protein